MPTYITVIFPNKECFLCFANKVRFMIYLKLILFGKNWKVKIQKTKIHYVLPSFFIGEIFMGKAGHSEHRSMVGNYERAPFAYELQPSFARPCLSTWATS